MKEKIIKTLILLLRNILIAINFVALTYYVNIAQRRCNRVVATSVMTAARRSFALQQCVVNRLHFSLVTTKCHH